MQQQPLSAGAILAATCLIDATSTFDPTAPLADNQRAAERALVAIHDHGGDGPDADDVASAAVICMQWLCFRATEQNGQQREELLWSLREFIAAIDNENRGEGHAT